ncbi:MAG TPA: DUF3800 domain-containing protein [Candidatus Limnocylindria bacterium]|nr:DUF3800 domain-containing protein [Candidatus Limnocylindria bacterium]
MFLVYGDESGQSGDQFDQNQPVLVVAAVLVNSYTGSRTRREYAALLEDLAELAGRPVSELKGSDLFRGRGAWAAPTPAVARAQARALILAWLAERRHKVAVSAIDIADFLARRAAGTAPNHRARTIASVHIALQVHLQNYGPSASDRQKKCALLLFDRHETAEQHEIARLVATPPDWAIDFLARHDELSMILDTALFVDSSQAPLIQVADFICFFVQRKAALATGRPESYVGEAADIDAAWQQLRPLLLPAAKRLPRSPLNAPRQLLRELTPDFLRT